MITISTDILYARQSDGSFVPIMGVQGEPGADGLPGDPGENGTPGKDALVNGRNTLTIGQGQNIILVETETGFDITATGSTLSATFTSTEVASGVALANNTNTTITGSVNNFVINSAGADGTVSFVAGDTTIITLPTGAGWNKDETPTIIPAKRYNLAYVNGTFYLDGGTTV